MDSLIYIIFACIALPLIISCFIMEKKSRTVIFFIIIGAFMCVFVSEVNTLLYQTTGVDYFYATTNITPITEEIVKALPILLYAFIFSNDRDTLLTLSMAVGIGFAIIENVFIFAQAGASYTLLWAIKRVFGASLMHGICTSSVGYGISFIKKKKKLFITGSFALLITAIVYHSLFNALVQSNYINLGLILPILTYIPIVITKLSKK